MGGVVGKSAQARSNQAKDRLSKDAENVGTGPQLQISAVRSKAAVSFTDSAVQTGLPVELSEVLHFGSADTEVQTILSVKLDDILQIANPGQPPEHTLKQSEQDNEVAEVASKLQLSEIAQQIEKGFVRRDDTRVHKIFSQFADVERKRIMPEKLGLALCEVGVADKIEAPGGLDLAEFTHAIRR